MVPATAQGQVEATGAAAAPVNMAPGPFCVRLELDDPEAQADLIPGAVGSVAIYTSNVKMAHIIRRVMIRVDAIMNYVNPA